MAVMAVMAVMPGTAQAQDARSFERAYARGDWAGAAKAGEIWVEREPGNSIAAFNTACAFARAGQPEIALGWLERAGQAGFAGTRSIDEDPDLAPARALAGFEAAVAPIRANRARMFTEFRAEAERSEILTLVPPGEPKELRPLVVVLHGYGGSPAPMAALYRRVALELGAILAAPSAIRPGPGGQGYTWTFRDEAEWWVLRAIERVTAEHEVDPSRLVLAGFSQGAGVALAVGLAHPERFAGILAAAGPFDEEWMRPPPDANLKVYLLVGQEDPAVLSSREAEAVLRADGLDVRLRVIPGLGHAFPQRATTELRTAFDFLLPGIGER
jgi:predicted esterase